MMKLRISETLNKILQEKKISLKELSKGSGVPSSTLSEWRTSGRSPNVEQAAKVADFLGITISHLLFGQEDKQEPLQKILREEFFKGVFEISIKKVHIKDGD